MNLEEAKALVGFESEAIPPAFYAQVPRCVLLDKRLSHAMQHLYAYLIARCSGEAPITWVAQGTMATDLGMQRQNVGRLLRRLEGIGLLLSRAPKDGGSRVYRLIDAVKVYGVLARAPWPKRGATLNHDDSPPASSGFTPLNHDDSPPCIMMIHKEEELHESEVHEEERTNPSAVGSARKRAHATPDDRALAERWLEHANAEMPRTTPYASWTPERWAEDVAKVRRLSGIDGAVLNAVFEWIKGDAWWRSRAISPAALLSKNGEGIRKIDNILLQIKNSKKYQESRPVEPVKDGDFLF